MQEDTQIDGRLSVALHPTLGRLRPLAQAFSERGSALYAVGGCVRDTVTSALLGTEVSPDDFDLATPSTPDEVMDVLRVFDGVVGEPDLQGKSFGVVRVRIDGTEFEIATFRRDVTMGRRPEVQVTSDITEDASRRDFTINAMYLDLTKDTVSDALVDPLGAIDDLRACLLVTPGDAALRFEEDCLRMLRAARFAARFGLTMAPELENAIRDRVAREGLVGLIEVAGDNSIVVGRIPQERVVEEFTKGCMQSHPSIYISLLCELGLMDKMFHGWLGLDFVVPFLPREMSLSEELSMPTDEDSLMQLVLSATFPMNVPKMDVEKHGFPHKQWDGSRCIRQMLDGSFSFSAWRRASAKVDMRVVSTAAAIESVQKANFDTCRAMALRNFAPSVDATTLGPPGPELGARLESEENEKFRMSVYNSMCDTMRNIGEYGMLLSVMTADDRRDELRGNVGILYPGTAGRLKTKSENE